MDTKFNEQESFSLINEMIAQARTNLHRNSAIPTIIAGYVVAAIAIMNVVLIYILPNPSLSFHIWWLMIPMSIVTSIVGRKQEEKHLVKTHIDRVLNSVWRAFEYSIIVILLSIFGVVFITQSWAFTLLITPIILTLLGFAQYIIAIACRFKPYHYGALFFWIGALFCTLSYFAGYNILQFIILAVCMIAGFVIPGHIANKTRRENV